LSSAKSSGLTQPPNQAIAGAEVVVNWQVAFPLSSGKTWEYRLHGTAFDEGAYRIDSGRFFPEVEPHPPGLYFYMG